MSTGYMISVEESSKNSVYHRHMPTSLSEK